MLHWHRDNDTATAEAPLSPGFVNQHLCLEIDEVFTDIFVMSDIVGLTDHGRPTTVGYNDGAFLQTEACDIIR